MTETQNSVLGKELPHIESEKSQQAPQQAVQPPCESFEVSSDPESTLLFQIIKSMNKQFENHKTLSLRALLHDNTRRFVGFTNMLQDIFQQMQQFCGEQEICQSTLLTALQYLKVHLGKQLGNKGQFKTMQDLFMIRVDAYVSLRLAMKMCDSRQEHLLPRPTKKSQDLVLQS